jgi:hypothetical protein
MEQARGSSGSTIKVSRYSYSCNCWQYLTNEDMLRWAKKKLPGEVKKKIEDWKLASGAMIMCLVAYSDGQGIETFQYVSIVYL